MFETLLNSISNQPSLGFSDPALVVMNLIIVLVLCLLVAITYQKTHRGLSYSQSYVLTLIIGGLVITAVMMVIGNNIARAFGAFGAFSLIRFRTAIKDAKDMGYMFLVLAIGMAVGSNNYVIAFATTIIVLAVMLVLNRMNFGSIRKFDYILSFHLDTRQNQENAYKVIFDKYLKSSGVLNIKAREQGHVLQLSFNVKFTSEKDSLAFTAELEKLAGISDVVLITAKNDVEY